jgi:hypothetical protein
VTSRATCRGTRTRGVGEVVDDEHARGGEVGDEWREVVNDEPARGGVVEDERHDKQCDGPRDVARHLDARRR